MRWYFGNNYDPFETTIKEGLHPSIHFLKQNSFIFKLIYFGIQYILLGLPIIYIFHYLKRFSHNCSKCISTYIKMNKNKMYHLVQN
jgi:hypothetical protein